MIIQFKPEDFKLWNCYLIPYIHLMTVYAFNTKHSLNFFSYKAEFVYLITFFGAGSLFLYFV